MIRRQSDFSRAAALLSKPRREPASAIYVHVPFCEQKCTFCDFFTITEPQKARASSLASDWLKLCARELHLLRDIGDLSPGMPIQTIYFGGGTPSLAPPDAIAQFIAAVHEELQLMNDAEVTLELQPGTADETKCREFAAAGVTRFSVGVQTFAEAILRTTGRRHDAMDSRELIVAASQSGVLSIDLIQAWPHQSLDAFRADLNEAISFHPTNISVYELTYHEETRISRDLARGRVQPANDELRVAMFWEAERILEAAGYEHYEVSNFALPGGRSHHNENYWKLGNYAGLGAGAHSFHFPHRYENPRDAELWKEAVAVGAIARAEADSGDPQIFVLENLTTALRLKEGIDIAGFEQRFQVDFKAAFGACIQKLVEGGFAQLHSGCFRLTSLGWLRADSLGQQLLIV